MRISPHILDGISDRLKKPRVKQAQVFMPLSPIQIAKMQYAITQADITNGFAGIRLTWPEPFADTDYAIVWGINDTGQNFLSLDYGVGDEHNITTQGFIAVMTFPAAAPIVQGQWDDFDQDAPTTLTFQPLANTLYQISIYLNPKVSENGGINPLASLYTTITYTGEGNDGPLTITPSDTIITSQGGVAQNTAPISASMAGPIVIQTNFSTDTIPGNYQGDTNYAVGTWNTAPAYGATITQANSGATAYYYGYVSGYIVYLPLTGVDDFASNWTATGGHTFTNGGGSQASGAGFYNTGATVVQAVSGATAVTINASGVDSNNFNVSSLTGIPDATHAWIDNSIFAVYIPTGVPVVGVPFHYHISARIVQMPSNSVIPPVGSSVTITALGIHI